MVCFLLCFLFKLYVGLEKWCGMEWESCLRHLQFSPGKEEKGQLVSTWPVSVSRRVVQRDAVFVSVCISGTDATISVFMTVSYSFFLSCRTKTHSCYSAPIIHGSQWDNFYD